MRIPEALSRRIEQYEKRLEAYPRLAALYRNCALSTVTTALEPCEDGTVFVLTGDIPAMWLRDSSALVRHYRMTPRSPLSSRALSDVS